MTDNVEKLLEIIQNLKENFNIYQVDDYQQFIQLLYNNVVILEEKDADINKALAELIYIIYQQIEIQKENNFSAKEVMIPHTLQKWMHIND